MVVVNHYHHTCGCHWLRHKLCDSVLQRLNNDKKLSASSYVSSLFYLYQMVTFNNTRGMINPRNSYRQKLTFHLNSEALNVQFWGLQAFTEFVESQKVTDLKQNVLSNVKLNEGLIHFYFIIILVLSTFIKLCDANVQKTSFKCEFFVINI